MGYDVGRTLVENMSYDYGMITSSFLYSFDDQHILLKSNWQEKVNIVITTHSMATIGTTGYILDKDLPGDSLVGDWWLKRPLRLLIVEKTEIPTRVSHTSIAVGIPYMHVSLIHIFHDCLKQLEPRCCRLSLVAYLIPNNICTKSFLSLITTLKQSMCSSSLWVRHIAVFSPQCYQLTHFTSQWTFGQRDSHLHTWGNHDNCTSLP